MNQELALAKLDEIKTREENRLKKLLNRKNLHDKDLQKDIQINIKIFVDIII